MIHSRTLHNKAAAAAAAALLIFTASTPFVQAKAETGVWKTDQTEIYYIVNGQPVKGIFELYRHAYQFNTETGVLEKDLGIDVSYYGAVPNDGKDDTDAINKALNNVKKDSGSKAFKASQ